MTVFSPFIVLWRVNTIIIIYHDFLPPPRRARVVMTSQITHTHTHTVINIHPIAQILDSWALIFSRRRFYSLSQPHHVTASLPSSGDNHQSSEGRSERTQGQAKMADWNSFSYNMYQGSPLCHIFRHCRVASTVIPLLPKAIPSHHPSMGWTLSNVRLGWTLSTYFRHQHLLAIRFSSILFTCPTHLKTLWSAVLANSLSITTLIRT